MPILQKAAVFALAFGSLISAVEAAPVATVCGASIQSIVKSDIEFFNTTSELPVNLTGASTAFDVPAGTRNCVRVRFSAIANCPNACFLRAVLDNTTELNPAWGSNPLRFSQDAMNSGTAHSFEWVTSVGPGHHVLRIEVQTGNTCCVASIGPWTNVVERLRSGH